MRDLTVCLLLGLTLFAVSFNGIGPVSADVGPSENECRPYIEKAINELKTVEPTDESDSVEGADSGETTLPADDASSIEETSAPTEDDGDSKETEEAGDDTTEETGEEGAEEEAGDDATEATEALAGEEGSDDDSAEKADSDQDSEEKDGDATENEEKTESDENAEPSSTDSDDDSNEKAEDNEENDTAEDTTEKESDEEEAASSDVTEETATEESSSEKDEGDDNKSGESAEQGDEEKADDSEDSDENKSSEKEASDENATEEAEAETGDKNDADSSESVEETTAAEEKSSDDDSEESEKDKEESDEKTTDDDEESTKEEESDEKSTDAVDEESTEEAATESDADSGEEAADDKVEEDEDSSDDEESSRRKREAPEEESEQADDSNEDAAATAEESNEDEAASTAEESNEDEAAAPAEESTEDEAAAAAETDEAASTETEEVAADAESNETTEETTETVAYPEDDLLLEFEIPKNLRDRSHVTELLRLDEESSNKENAIQKQADVILRDLKRIYDNAIKPLETLYKYRDLSNRHFGDPEIFSKPLILFMGPWSGGKSTILNYLTDNEYTANSVRSGAEPSPAYFNILMHGDEPEVLDGTQLAADWTFSGLQKFGQGLLDRLRGQRLPNKLLEKVNIVEIPGILEVRKHVSRYFPFNDACQWFIDRADIIFLVYDPSKLDVGPETEAILDQLKGREYQTRILLNKADQVKPEELLRVQGALIWNISPLMSSAQPPVMYTVSLWSHPYEVGSPSRLLQAQERAFLRDLRDAIDKRIDNKISSARRFAVRVRNHAKMVDCYLTTYYNHKTIFGNKKQISNQIIEHPQNYHIYEGLSTLTNISRYDLPDPDVYRDFFRLNALFEFKKLSETCTYFKGCPINKLDIAIAYDLPDLVGKYKKLSEQVLSTIDAESTPPTTTTSTTTQSTPTRKS